MKCSVAVAVGAVPLFSDRPRLGADRVHDERQPGRRRLDGRIQRLLVAGPACRRGRPRGVGRHAKAQVMSSRRVAGLLVPQAAWGCLPLAAALRHDANQLPASRLSDPKHDHRRF